MDELNIFRDGVLVDVDVSFWSGSKVLKAEDLGLKPEEVAEAYKLGKKLLIPSEVIREFRAIESKARRIVEENSFPFPIGNARFIPKKRYSEILEKLKEYQTQYGVLVEKLIENYEQYRQEMLPIYQQAAETAYINQRPDKMEFGMDYDPIQEKAAYINAFLERIESYYPPANSLRRRFSLSWDVYEIALPRMAKEGEITNQTQQKINGFIDEVVKTLRQQTVDVCTRIANNIKEGKIIKSTTIDSLSKFVERFENLNFIGDSEIEGCLAKLRQDILDAYPHDTFADNEELKVELARKLQEISEVASVTDINSVTGEYRRKIVWQEEPELVTAE